MAYACGTWKVERGRFFNLRNLGVFNLSGLPASSPGFNLKGFGEEKPFKSKKASVAGT